MKESDSYAAVRYCYDVKCTKEKLRHGEAPQPLGVFLELILTPAGSRESSVPVYVRFDTATDYTTLPWSKLREAGILGLAPFKTMTINRGAVGQYEADMYPCTFKLQYRGTSIATISTIVACAPKPGAVKKSYRDYVKDIKKWLQGEQVQQEPQGVLSLADVMTQFDVQFFHTKTGPRICLTRKKLVTS